MSNFNRHRNAYKANVLFFLLSSLVIHKLFAIQHYIATEQSFRYKEPTDAKIWVPKLCHYARFSQIRSHVMRMCEFIDVVEC